MKLITALGALLLVACASSTPATRATEEHQATPVASATVDASSTLVSACQQCVYNAACSLLSDGNDSRPCCKHVEAFGNCPAQ